MITMNITVQNEEGVRFLSELPDSSIDLILTDPPYLISKESGMNKFAKKNDSHRKNRQKHENGRRVGGNQTNERVCR